MRWISAALLLASLLIGLSHVAGLPPFEGIDETAHYSYIEQIAKTGTLPRFGDKLRQDAQDVEDSLEAAPGPTHSVVAVPQSFHSGRRNHKKGATGSESAARSSPHR